MLLAIALVCGCQRHRPVGDQAVKPNPVAKASFDRIVQDLWDSDEKVRESGLKALAEYSKAKKDPGTEIGLAAIKAAARPYPFAKPDPNDVCTALIRVAYTSPHAEYVPVVVELFDKFSDGGKSAAQILLTELESREAAEGLMTIVRTHAPTGKLSSLLLARLIHKPRHADVFFPEIMEFTENPWLSYEIHHLCLAYCEANLLPAKSRGPLTAKILKAYATVAKKVWPAQKDKGVAWMWEVDYEEPRNEAALILDLLGYFPGDEVGAQLDKALDFKDPRLKHFAVISLLRLGKPVEKQHVADVACHAEMRNSLYDRLEELGKTALFPEEFRNQRAFAEADMVSWLVYPTELNRVPDQIELMKIVPIDTGLRDGIYDYYLFRFRTQEPHWAAKNGWIAGVSGPFLRQDQPTTHSLGDTFSHFTKWDDKTPDEHVGDVKELIARWREYHSKTKEH
jgi:hypothetical protein